MITKQKSNNKMSTSYPQRRCHKNIDIDSRIYLLITGTTKCSLISGAENYSRGALTSITKRSHNWTLSLSLLHPINTKKVKVRYRTLIYTICYNDDVNKKIKIIKKRRGTEEDRCSPNPCGYDNIVSDVCKC